MRPVGDNVLSQEIDITLAYALVLVLIIFAGRLIWKHIVLRELERHKIRRLAAHEIVTQSPDDDREPFTPEDDTSESVEMGLVTPGAKGHRLGANKK